MRFSFPLARLYESDLVLMRSADRIVLFGAGLHVEPAVHALREIGLEPVFICDNSIAKQGNEIAGVPIKAPGECGISKPGTVVIITSAVAYVEEITRQIRSLGCQTYCTCVSLFASLNYTNQTFSRGISPFHYDLNRYLSSFFQQYHSEKLIIENLDIVVTEKCSLKCRDCSNLMQYYEHPSDLDFDQTFRALDRVMASVDHLLEFRVLGGETFMNREASTYINRLQAYSNASRIVVYTNGTILPPPQALDALQKDDVLVRVTDYGPISRKVGELASLFRRAGIAFEVEPCTTWQDCATIVREERDLDELAEQFSHCQTRNFLTLLKEKVYLCPFAANSMNLTAIPDSPDAYVRADGSLSDTELRNELRGLLADRSFTTACLYCRGRHSEPSIPSAIQTAKPLPFA